MDVTLNFRITGLDGGIVTSDNTKYKGISKTFEIGNEPQGYDFYPGDVYKGGIVYLMVKNDSDYLFKEIEKHNKKEYKTYVHGR